MLNYSTMYNTHGSHIRVKVAIPWFFEVSRHQEINPWNLTSNNLWMFLNQFVSFTRSIKHFHLYLNPVQILVKYPKRYIIFDNFSWATDFFADFLRKLYKFHYLAQFIRCFENHECSSYNGKSALKTQKITSQEIPTFIGSTHLYFLLVSSNVSFCDFSVNS